MLVIVHNGNSAFAYQSLLNLEALRSFDVFKVNPAKARSHSLNNINKALGISFINFKIKGIEAGKDFEEKSLAFHYRLSRLRADIAKPEHGRAI